MQGSIPWIGFGFMFLFSIVVLRFISITMNNVKGENHMKLRIAVWIIAISDTISAIGIETIAGALPA
jgi:hypothetical protein